MHHLHSEAMLRQANTGGPAPAPITAPAQNAAVSTGNVFITVGIHSSAMALTLILEIGT
jgi:hypothetical protein